MTEEQLLKGSETAKHFLIKMLIYYLLKKERDFSEVRAEHKLGNYVVDVCAWNYDREDVGKIVEVSQNTVQKDRRKLLDLTKSTEYLYEDHLIKAQKYPSNLNEIMDRLRQELI